MRSDCVNAFLDVSGGYSADRVLADPVLNESYILKCRSFGQQASTETLNRFLLNARKAGALTEYKTKHRTSLHDEAEYAFASEIAMRFLERRDEVTLDDVICSPDRAAEFDTLAKRICPGFSSLQYRWAALNLRKRRRLKPERLAQVRPPHAIIQSPVVDFDLATAPCSQGLYIFFDSTHTLYVGESTNLKKRLKKHLDHSDNKGLAQWLWAEGTDDMHVELQILPDGTPTRVRRALEAELIESRNPEFNVKGR